MYQGKFDAKVRGHKSPDENLQNILTARNAEKAQAAAKAAAKRTAAADAKKTTVQRPAAGAPAQRPVPVTPVQKPAAPAAQKPVQQPKPPVKPAAPQVVEEDASVKAPKAAKPAKKSKSSQKGSSVGTTIFYTLYFLFIFAFFAGTFFLLQWLNGWLQDYEAAQPTVKSQEVFDQYFADPDWGKLYDLAHVSNTEYEGVDQFVPFMDEKLGGKKFDYVATSAGLSSDKKYIVRADGEKFATFTLTDKNTDADPDSVTYIPDWQLGKIDLFFSRQSGYLIQKLDGHTAYVNGVPLDDSFTIQTASTKAEKFLPIGTAGVRTSIQRIDGLLMPPTVTVYNQTGEEIEVVYDDETGTFIEQTTETTMSEAEGEAALGALKAYAEFMINANGSRAAVSKYFDGSSDVYNDILKMHSELWMNHDYGHRFNEESLDGYARYSDELFSIHGHVNMNVTCKDGTLKDYPVDQSLFFRKKNGKWVCYEMTNEDVTKPVGEVRLTFMNEDTELSTGFVETNASTIMTPVIAVPDGKVFSGWAKKTVSDSGRITYTLVFVPDEDGLVQVNYGTTLEPMILYALLENA